MHQDDTMRLLITITKLLAFVLAALTLVMWL